MRRREFIAGLLAAGTLRHARAQQPAKVHRGHNTANPRPVFISGQKRGVFGVIKRELRRRSAIEAAIGHMKSDGHLGRCYLKGREGDAANVILTAVGYNLRLVLALAEDSAAPHPARPIPTRCPRASVQIDFLTADELVAKFRLIYAPNPFSSIGDENWT
jgi:hypothetical protein